MQSSPVILLVAVCGIFLVFAAGFAVMVVTSRKDNEAYARIAQSLGFTPLENTDELMQRICFLRDIKPEPHHRLTHVYCRTHATGAKTCMYNLSFRSNSRAASGSGRKSSYSPLESNAVAFISPAWKLPLFSTLLRVDGDGVMAKLGNTVLEKAVDIKHEIVKFPHIPKLDELYIIFTPDSSPANVLPSDGFLRILAKYPNLDLHAGGDTFTLSFFDSKLKSPSEEKMKQLFKIGMELARELGETHRSSLY